MGEHSGDRFNFDSIHQIGSQRSRWGGEEPMELLYISSPSSLGLESVINNGLSREDEEETQVRNLSKIDESSMLRFMLLFVISKNH